MLASAASILGLCCLLVPALRAQTVPPPPVAPAAATTDDQISKLPSFSVTEAQDKGYLASNAVSGTRINTPIADLPFSITAFTPQFIEDTGSRNLGDVVQYAAGVRSGAMEFDAGDANFMIRGFTQAPEHDGFYQSAQGNVYVDTSTIERVEVVKGPASLLYGQIAPGGTVNIITKRANDTAFSTISIEGGSYDYGRVALDVNQPLIPNVLNFRLNAMWENNFEYAQPSKERTIVVDPTFTWKLFKNLSLTVNYQDFTRTETPPAYFLPNTEIADPASIVAGFSKAAGYPLENDPLNGALGLAQTPYGSSDVDNGYNDQSNPGQLMIPSVYSKRFNYAGAGDSRQTVERTVNAELDATIGDHWTARGLFDYNDNTSVFKFTGYGGLFIAPTNSLVYANGAWAVSPSWAALSPSQQLSAYGAYVTAITQNNSLISAAQNGTPAPLVMARRQKYEVIGGSAKSAEAEAAGNYDFSWAKIKPLVGIYEDQAYVSTFAMQNRGNAASPFFQTWDINPASPTYYINNNTNFDPTTLARNSANQLSYVADQAAYATVSGSLFDDRLLFVAGVRYNRSETITTNYLGANAAGVYGQGYKAHYTTPQAGVGYKITPDLMLYASYSTSYQIPSTPYLSTLQFVNGFPVAAPTSQAVPTTGVGYEAGIKTSFLAGRISSTLSVYQITQSNVEVSVQPIVQGVNVNLQFQGAEVRSKGVEYEVTLSPTDNWQIFASVTDDNAINIAEPVGQTYYLGEMPENVARYLANLWTRYNINVDPVKGLWVGGGFNYSSKSEGVSTSISMFDPSYVQWNSAAGYDWTSGKTKLTFAVNFDNMFNVLVIPAEQDRGLPRRITATLTAKF